MATNDQKQPMTEEPSRNSLIQRMLQSAFSKSKRPKNLRELGISALTSLPANIGMMRSFMQSVNWKEAQGGGLAGLRKTVLIAGRPNTGKSTLLNHLKAKQLPPV